MSSPYHRRYWYLKRDEQLSKSWFHKLPVHTQRDPSPVSTSLCFGCDSLDLPGIVARMRIDPEMKSVALPPWTDSAGFPRNDGACALCALFSANWDREGSISIEWMEPTYFDRYDNFSSWSPAAVVFHNSNWMTKAVFEIIPTQDDHPDPMTRLLHPTSIDFDRIQLWLQYCSNDDVAPLPRRKSAYLPGFCLIQCKSREIIKPLQECRYVALSYVWGKNPPQESQDQCFPPTIEDAIKVCLELGFEYIWIDRYCIDQGNYEDKHNQISQMDVIYSKASLVIIAAAGNDPTYGLPGVSAQVRMPQQSVKLKDCTLLQTFPRVYDELRVSAWINRGWTLQEGYFGTRKLIFTDYQVIYVCEHGYCNESVFPRTTWDPTLREWCRVNEHECGRQRYQFWLSFYFLFKENQSQTNTGSARLNKCGIIEEFTKRSLSYDSDVYNAIYGVLNSWSKAEPSNTVGHIYGVPVGKEGPRLCWYGDHDTRTPRREGFPTWSWLSRKGPIIGFPSRRSLASVSVQKPSDIDLEATSKRETIPSEQLWVSIAECSNRSDLQTRPYGADGNPHLIRISGWCPRVRMSRQSVNPSQYVKSSECTIKKLVGRLRLESQEDDLSIDRHDLTQTEWESCVTVLIGSTEDSHQSPLTIQDRLAGLSFLILCPTSEKNIYERVGIFYVWLTQTFSRVSDRRGDETPDWDGDRCDDGHIIEELDSIDDFLMFGLTMTHDMRQGLYRTQEDEANDYDLRKDPNRFVEEPDEDFEDSIVFPLEFPDWKTRVFIVR
ncbi:unnamed protein product [Alternaria burnsii]|nr:unnamed protein product [Alternaria burnsii]